MKTGLYLNCPCGVGVSLCCEGEGFFCQCGRGYVRNGDAIICNQDPQPTPEPRPFQVGDRVQRKGGREGKVTGVTAGAFYPIGGDCHPPAAPFWHRAGDLTLIKPAPDKAEAGEAHGTGERETAMTPSKVTGAESCRDNIAVVPLAKAACTTQYCGGHGHPVSWCPTHGWLEGSREMNGGLIKGEGEDVSVFGSVFNERIEWAQKRLGKWPPKPPTPPLYKRTAGPKPKWWQPW